MLSRIKSLFRNLFRKLQVEHDLDQELRSHLELLIAEKMAQGLNPHEAARQAKLELGGIEQVKEQVRATRTGARLESLLRNLRFALRILRKSPGFTTVIVLTLALGIGANTAIFTVAYAALLAPLPYPHPEQLVNVWSKVQDHRDSISVGDFVEWRRQNTLFQDMNLWSPDDFNIATLDRPEDVEGMSATPGYADMLGNPLFLGRYFIPEEAELGK
jgi:hypothetical protein